MSKASGLAPVLAWCLVLGAFAGCGRVFGVDFHSAHLEQDAEVIVNQDASDGPSDGPEADSPPDMTEASPAQDAPVETSEADSPGDSSDADLGIDECSTESCGFGQHCSNGTCVCDGLPCPGCCVGNVCRTGIENEACGVDGEGCHECSSDTACSAGTCATLDKVVLTGGVFHGHSLGDTWTWNGSVWEEVPQAGMTERAWPAMATINHNVALFSGTFIKWWDPSYVTVSDTWLWNGSVWKEVSDSGPPARRVHAMAELGGVAVLFGGEADHFTFLGDTWTWDGSEWAQVLVTGPVPRYEHAMATLNGKVLLYGGTDLDHDFGDTWTWDGSEWAQVSDVGPAPRTGHAMATLNGVVVLFGGEAEGTVMGDTWTWSGSKWTKVSESGPSSRTGLAMATHGDRIVAFGGIDSDYNVFSDTWTWDGSAWTKVSESGPSPRAGHAMATFR